MSTPTQGLDSCSTVPSEPEQQPAGDSGEADRDVNDSESYESMASALSPYSPPTQWQNSWPDPFGWDSGLFSHAPGLPAQARVQTAIALPCLPTLQEGQTATTQAVATQEMETVTTQAVATQEMDLPNMLRLCYTLETGSQRSFPAQRFLTPHEIFLRMNLPGPCLKRGTIGWGSSTCTSHIKAADFGCRRIGQGTTMIPRLRAAVPAVVTATFLLVLTLMTPVPRATGSRGMLWLIAR